MLKNNKDFWQSDVNLPDDPYTIKEGAEIRTSQTGKNAMRPPQANYGDKGFITEVFPATHSYTVQTDMSGLLQGVQRLTQSPGDKTLLQVGTLVAINYCYGPPVIAGVMMYSTPVENEQTPTSITGVEGRGADDPVYKNPGAANYRPEGTPRDLSPNDWSQNSSSGNLIGVLDGGVNIMKSTDFAQIRTHLLNDVVEIISQRFRHVTGMGFSEYKDEGGRTSYVFRGGSDQTTECGSDQENWTIRFDLGDAGDLFKLELSQPDGTSAFRVHVSPDGKADLFAAKGFNWNSGDESTSKNLSNEISEIKGNADKLIRGKETRTVYGERNTVISANDSKSVGNDVVESMMRHFTKSVGGQAKYTFVGGNPATATPLNDALAFEIVNGSWKVNIGDPTSLANPAALAGFDLKTFMGDISMEASVAGNVNFKTLLGDAKLETLAGLATLKTSAGIANVDGTSVNLGPVGPSFANPVVKGTLHATAMATYLGANAAAFATMTGATTALITALTSPVIPLLTWVLAAPLVLIWLNIVNTTFTALIASNAALAAAIPGTLSPQVFTA